MGGFPRIDRSVRAGGDCVCVGVGGRRDVQPSGHSAKPLQERLFADRRAAQAAVRPDPESGRSRQGLHQARAGDARSGDSRPATRPTRPGSRPPATPATGGDDRPGRRRRPVDRRPGPAVRRGRGLSRPEGQPEHAGPARRAFVDREQDRLRPAGLQRLGHGLQHAAGGVPHVDHRRRCSTSRRPTCSRSSSRPSGRPRRFRSR